MKLHTLKIKGFRRISNAEVKFGDTTFLIGSNNVGKSSVFAALDALVRPGKSGLGSDDFHKCLNENGEECFPIPEVELEAEFRDVPSEAFRWQGFRGRVLRYEAPPESNESGLKIVYRKVFKPQGDVNFAMLSYPSSLKEPFASAKNIESLVENGIPEDDVREIFGVTEGKINKQHREKLEGYDPAWEINQDDPIWVENPGGFQSIVASKLPAFILIPLDDGRGEITERQGALEKIMAELFNEVRNESDNYKMAQEYLDQLALELAPDDSATPFGQLMNELNGVLASVFDDAQFHASADLSNPKDTIKPTFKYEMSSNVRTPVSHQGSGMIRSAAFALLRFRQQWLSTRGKKSGHGLIIGFEEPELYLHPNAADQMRDAIYDLSCGDMQIVCSTHSPYMVDLSRKERQVLNSMKYSASGIICKSFSLSDAFQSLQGDDRHYVKMLQCMNSHASRVFFSDYVVVVEGPSEDIVLRETIGRMPASIRKSVMCGVHIFNAHGKATIISLVKYLSSFGIEPFVIHDGDNDTPGAAKFNKPIADAVGDDSRILILSNCIEDELGYKVPQSDKPYNAYRCASSWGNTWEDVPNPWRSKIEHVFRDYFLQHNCLAKNS